MSVLVCLHHPLEGPDVFSRVLAQEGIGWERLEFFRDPLARPLNDHSHLLVMGGAMNVDQTEEYPFLIYERELIRDFIGRGRPVLGICLGAQLIARALGAKVYQNRVPEVGWSFVRLTAAGRRDPLLADFRPIEPVFQWHGDTFEVPDGCEWLAESELCPHQAFRYGAKTYALQFHLEASPPTIASWMQNEEGREVILRQTAQYGERANETARLFFRRWLALA